MEVTTNSTECLCLFSSILPIPQKKSLTASRADLEERSKVIVKVGLIRNFGRLSVFVAGSVLFDAGVFFFFQKEQKKNRLLV